MRKLVLTLILGVCLAGAPAVLAADLPAEARAAEAQELAHLKEQAQQRMHMLEEQQGRLKREQQELRAQIAKIETAQKNLAQQKPEPQKMAPARPLPPAHAEGEAREKLEREARELQARLEHYAKELKEPQTPGNKAVQEHMLKEAQTVKMHLAQIYAQLHGQAAPEAEAAKSKEPNPERRELEEKASHLFQRIHGAIEKDMRAQQEAVQKMLHQQQEGLEKEHAAMQKQFAEQMKALAQRAPQVRQEVNEEVQRQVKRLSAEVQRLGAEVKRLQGELKAQAQPQVK